MQAREELQEKSEIYISHEPERPIGRRRRPPGLDDGGYDSGDGSDAFEQDSRKGYDSDESNGAQKRNKRN